MSDRKLIFMTLLALAAAMLFYPRKSSSPQRAAVAVTGPLASNSLTTETRADMFYALPPAQGRQLLQAVEFFCAKDYKRDSCLHHLITCGMPCVVAVPRARRKALFQDYQSARLERGLLPLPARTTED